MNPIIKHIDGSIFVDAVALWQSITTIPVENKLTTLLEQAGVTFHDQGRRFIAEPVVAIVGIGGIPIHLNENQQADEVALAIAPHSPFKREALREASHLTMGMSAFCSYLNPRNIGPQEMCAVSFQHGHTSVAHTVMVNLLILGHSCGVENEFNSQRDLIHISRVTVARTQAQKDPPIVVLNEDHIPYYQRVLDQTQQVLMDAPSALSERGQLESRNLLFPAAKGSLMMVTASLRNLQKLMLGIADTGKEEEYKKILEKMKNVLSGIWGELFA